MDGAEPALCVYVAGLRCVDEIVPCVVLAGDYCAGNRESGHGWK